MIKVKVSELFGAALDWAVAKAEGLEVYQDEGVWRCDISPSNAFHTIGRVRPDREGYSPSTEWSQGGPLIESCAVTLAPYSVTVSGAVNYWVAEPWGENPEPIDGKTALIAGCRAIVAGMYGQRIEIPEELLNPA